MKKINWFWVHRRNSTLHHMSLLAKGFHNNGFSPAVNFNFYNQIFVGKPEKGVYIFYDRDELNKKFKDIQKSIEQNSNFASDFKKVSDNIFANIFTVCNKIKNTDLIKAGSEELLDLLIEFKEKITAGPIITVQLWGIEACWDSNYLLSKELQSKLPNAEFSVVKGKLSKSTGKSVALSEKESFLNVCVEIQKIKELNNVFKSSTPKEISKELNNYPNIKSLMVKHIDNFEWINSEYISEKWNLLDWIGIFKHELGNDTANLLKDILQKHNLMLKDKQNLIYDLKLSDESKHVLTALNEFVSERDWVKGKFCYALSVYDLLLEEIVNRLNTSKEDILYMEIEELINFMKSKNKIFTEKRKEGFALVSKQGNIQIVETDELGEFLSAEGIEETFSPVTQVKSFGGVIASQGKVTGRVRVIENPEQMSEFKEGEILVTYMTTMEFTPIFGKAAGIITDEGGLSSHAAIISREFGLPCIVGTNIATRNLKTEDLIELNASEGKITILHEDAPHI